MFRWNFLPTPSSKPLRNANKDLRTSSTWMIAKMLAQWNKNFLGTVHVRTCCNAMERTNLWLSHFMRRRQAHHCYANIHKNSRQNWVNETPHRVTTQYCVYQFWRNPLLFAILIADTRTQQTQGNYGLRRLSLAVHVRMAKRMAEIATAATMTIPLPIMKSSNRAKGSIQCIWWKD